MDVPKSRVKLSFKCFNLVDKDWLSKSDPIVILQEKKKPEDPWTFVGRTEMIKDNQNPTFNEKITLEYTFETKQYLQIIVLDIDDPRNLPTSYVPNAAETDLLGRVECLLSEIVGARNSTYDKDLTGSKAGRKYGRIRVQSEELAEGARAGDTLVLRMQGKDLAAKDGMFGKSDPFLVFQRRTPDGSLAKLHTTEYVNQNLNPEWKEIRLDMLELCNGDLARPVIIECWDYDSMSSPDSIGDVTTCVGDLIAHRPLVLLDRKNRPELAGKCGTLITTSAKIYRLPSFLDYVSMGCEISLSVAVDFTASNGTPGKDAHSLHRPYDPARAAAGQSPWNEYQQALIAVGEILAPYDTDKQITAFGFGGIPPGPSGQVSFCFPLNGDGAKPEVPGVQGLLDAYAQAIQAVKLYGPTNMAPVIAQINSITRETLGRRGLFYNILLIITDGTVTDLNQTIDAVVDSSTLPISVVIVGVQNEQHAEDFEGMHQLDGDDVVLTDGRGVKAARDIVQFVPFNPSLRTTPEELAKHVLGEVPHQLVQHFSGKGLKPASWGQPGADFYELLNTLPPVPKK